MDETKTETPSWPHKNYYAVVTMLWKFFSIIVAYDTMCYDVPGTFPSAARIILGRVLRGFLCVFNTLLYTKLYSIMVSEMAIFVFFLPLF